MSHHAVFLRAGESGGGGPVRPLVFLHIPKTAGMSLRRVLTRAYDGLPIEFLTNFGGELAAFAQRPAAERVRVALLAGHIPWGAQAALPGSRVITVVRDPVERVISSYAFARRAPNALHHDRITSENLSLADVVESGLFAGEMNLMTTMLASRHAKTGEQAAASAVQNLRSCAAVGVVERFDESLALFARTLRWPAEAVGTEGGGPEVVNRTPDRERAADLDPALVERIRRESWADRRVYEAACALLDERAAGG